MPIAKNEPLAQKRRVPVAFYDNDGILVGGLTFLTASNEVFVSIDAGVTWIAAANNGVQTTGAPTPAQQTYYYEFSQAETNHDVAFIGVLFHKAGYDHDEPVWADIDFSASNTAAIAVAVLDAARSGHVVLGSIGEGIALSASLLQGNFFIDNVTPSDNGPTAQRLRCWLSAAAMAGVTPGGSGQGEFATFLVTTAYSGPNKISTHKVVQQ